MSVALPLVWLASQSPRRRDILGGLGVPFSVVSSRYEENPNDVLGLPPASQAERLALLKAEAAEVPPRVQGVVIGADTIVVCDQHILGKPRDREDARRMLQLLSGRVHEVMTGLAVVRYPDSLSRSHTERTRVSFRTLGSADIDWYLDSGEPFDKAGAYAIQGGASLFVDRIEGCYFNVVGFPVVALDTLFSQLSIRLLDYMKRGGGQ